MNHFGLDCMCDDGKATFHIDWVKHGGGSIMTGEHFPSTGTRKWVRVDGRLVDLTVGQSGKKSRGWRRLECHVEMDQSKARPKSNWILVGAGANPTSVIWLGLGYFASKNRGGDVSLVEIWEKQLYNLLNYWDEYKWTPHFTDFDFFPLTSKLFSTHVAENFYSCQVEFICAALFSSKTGQSAARHKNSTQSSIVILSNAHHQITQANIHQTYQSLF